MKKKIKYKVKHFPLGVYLVYGRWYIEDKKKSK